MPWGGLVACALACSVGRPQVASLPKTQAPHDDFRPEDDGPHPSSESGYFEWWYYDATFADGTSATVALYAATMLAERGPPGVLVNVVQPGGKGLTSYIKAERSEVSFGRPGEVWVGRSAATRLDTGDIRLVAFGTAEGMPLEVELTFSPTMPGFKVGSGEVRLDGKVALGWVVPVPRAAVQGRVRVGRAERSVNGWGYHDHNWGELNLEKTMAYWYWGRIATEDLSAVFTSVHFREELGLPPLRAVIAGDSRAMRHALSAVDFTALGERYLEAAGRDIPAGLSISGRTFTLELRERAAVEVVDLSARLGLLRPFARLFTRPAYVRTLADYRWSAPQLAFVPAASGGTALVEYMYVWKR